MAQVATLIVKYISVHNINISSSAILVQMLASFFSDWHPARFSFAIRHTGTPVRHSVPACWTTNWRVAHWHKSSVQAAN